MSKEAIEVSATDQAKVAVLEQVIAESRQKIAAILGPYLGFREAAIAQPLPQAYLDKHADPTTEKHCQFLIIDANGSCGCYRDPPGVCELC